MKLKRIEIEGPAGRAAIERDGVQIRVDSILREPKGERTWTTEILSATQLASEPKRLWSIARMIQRRCDGVCGTNSEIEEYRDVLMRFAD